MLEVVQVWLDRGAGLDGKPRLHPQLAALLGGPDVVIGGLDVEHKAVAAGTHIGVEPTLRLLDHQMHVQELVCDPVDRLGHVRAE